MSEFLLELFSEEIPARMQARAAGDLERLMADALKAANLQIVAMHSHVTPRRLVLVVEGLPETQPDMVEERRGPRADAPERAIAGFKGSLPEGAVIEDRVEKKGTFLFAKIEQKGRKTADVLADIVPDIIRNFPWPKSMRAGTSELRWVRPLLSILALLDGQVVPVTMENIKSGKETRGHRFLSQGTISVENFADYQSKLNAAHVLLDAQDRRKVIQDRAQALASQYGLELVEDAALLDENAGLTEWPVPYLGRFDAAFLSVPAEVLITSMKVHQKFFSLRDPKSGKLAPNFICVANTEASDDGAMIVAGNERVLSARLSDARFFWEQDLKRPLEDRVDALSDIIFHEKLGTLAERVGRIEALAVRLAQMAVKAPDDQVRRAAVLAKADLTTGMVGEFPELQGLVGRRIAEAQGEHADVARAIEEHYAPRGPEDRCPQDPVSICVALAEKLDTLTGFFAIDEKPTGSKDPFALRRAALGVIRLIVENGLRLKLGDYLDASNGLLEFFADRLKVQQREKGMRHDLIDAVFSLGGEDDLVRLLARVSALDAFLKSDDGANLLAGYKRAANILKIEGKKDKTADWGTVDPALFDGLDEKTLFEKLGAAGKEAAKALELEDFAAAMRALASLRAPIDAFFDDVTVNADDPELRRNRLALLAQIRTAVDQVADFSKIEG
ncbi:glycine--tRNA ligase beta subunit [Iodidimonas muriae]|uniref:Glycine--tRNA ligase beta subunit n=1 Tax=Iodidimonas muriae TaxID=261467 RepID=A0ABQ2LEH6_9PROT|nr:glycine--tRNA ligase subunit beta [Iodidimonas muriae]GER07607.1 glycine--tRNA ligase beta subunit [Kordiimonadales bacterium JCM 17843]GGO13758.1 glycine--tRNA ligase beta subunit [Iodidimonas muriae]